MLTEGFGPRRLSQHQIDISRAKAYYRDLQARSIAMATKKHNQKTAILTQHQYRTLPQRDIERLHAEAYYQKLQDKTAAAAAKTKRKPRRPKPNNSRTDLERAKRWSEEQIAASSAKPSPRPILLVESPNRRDVLVELRQQQSPILYRRESSRQLDPPVSNQTDENEFVLAAASTEEEEESARPIKSVDPPTRQLCFTPDAGATKPECPASPVGNSPRATMAAAPHPLWGQQFSAFQCIAQATFACIVGPSSALLLLVIFMVLAAFDAVWCKPRRVAKAIHKFLRERPNESFSRTKICGMFPCRSYDRCYNAERWIDADGVEQWQWKGKDE